MRGMRITVTDLQFKDKGFVNSLVSFFTTFLNKDREEIKKEIEEEKVEFLNKYLYRNKFFIKNEETENMEIEKNYLLVNSRELNIKDIEMIKCVGFCSNFSGDLFLEVKGDSKKVKLKDILPYDLLAMNLYQHKNY